MGSEHGSEEVLCLGSESEGEALEIGSIDSSFAFITSFANINNLQTAGQMVWCVSLEVYVPGAMFDGGLAQILFPVYACRAATRPAACKKIQDGKTRSVPQGTYSGKGPSNVEIQTEVCCGLCVVCCGVYVLCSACCVLRAVCVVCYICVVCVACVACAI